MMSVWWKDLITAENRIQRIIPEIDPSVGTIIEKSQYDAFYWTPWRNCYGAKGVNPGGALWGDDSLCVVKRPPVQLLCVVLKYSSRWMGRRPITGLSPGEPGEPFPWFCFIDFYH